MILYYSKDNSGISFIFRQELNQVLDLLPKSERQSFLDSLFDKKNPQKINETELSQLVLFSISYALAKTLISLGVKPTGLIGHSIGELTAATVSGVFELKDAVEMVLMRGKIMQRQQSEKEEVSEATQSLGVNIRKELRTTTPSPALRAPSPRSRGEGENEGSSFEGLSELLKDEDGIFIELGSGNNLCSIASTHVSKTKKQLFITLLPHSEVVQNTVWHINQKLGQLWCHGIDIDWQALKGDAVRNRLSLPTYVFDRVFFPIEIGIEPHAVTMEEPSTASLVDESREPLQKIIIEAYKTVLGFNTIELHQDFFSLGGDSLTAASLAAALNNQLSIKIDIQAIFENPSPFTLADYLSKTSAEKESYPRITAATFKDYYSLSSAQSRMYTLYLLDKNSLAYNLPSATLIKGPLNIERFEQAVKKLVERHEALRTVFTIRENQLVQVILPDYTVPILYSESQASSQNEMTELVYQFIKPFDLEQKPPFRVELVEIGTSTYLLLFDIHHIIADGTSMEIITRDFNQLYFQELPLPNIHYKDFAVWQNNYLESAVIKEQEQFWRAILGGELPVLELPTDFKRPAIKTFNGDRVYFTLDETWTEQLIHLSQKTGTTLFMLFLGMWNVFIARYSNQEDLIVGVPVSGRSHKEIEETVGMFVNMLPMRNHPENKKKFIDFLTEVKENALNAFKNQDYQFDKLVKQLSLKRDTSRNALFELCFNFENMKLYELEIEDLHFIPYSFGTRSAVYDLTLTLSENKKQGTIEGFIEYATRLFKRETIERMVANFQTMLRRIVEDNEILIEEIDIVSPSEKQLFATFNDTSLGFKNKLLIQGLFEQNVKDFPDKIALIVSNGKSLTYTELNEKANALAWHLIERGLKKEAIVGIMTSRDESLLISLLGVLKAGGAYLAIDPEYPVERISYMLSHCNVSFLICPRQYRNKIEFNGYILSADAYQYSQNNPALDWDNSGEARLAYVLFTSGSTGKPKAVMIEHISIMNLIHEVKSKNYFPNQEDRMLSMTTASFDIFAFESLIPLCIGNSVYLANEIEQLDPAIVGKKIIEHKVTHLFSTISRLKAFVESSAFHPALKKLKCLFSGGENFPLQLLNYLQKHTQAKIYNMYGPTETTIWSTLKELTHDDEINVGSPITNTQAYIINQGGKLQPIGVFGELCLAGYGLARGYLNDPKETHAKFIRLTDIASSLIYKTGDRARFLGHGEIEISGRLDTQVKVRGYRIELKEIEELVLQHANIHQAVVIPFEDKKQNKQLALYYCLKYAQVSSDDAWLKSWLEERLPYYMIPTSFISLDKMPLLPNGKIDRKALSLLTEQSCPIKISEHTLTNIENALLSFWKEQLDIENIGVKDNFFDLGGNSLSLIYINNKLNTWLGRPVSLLQHFEYPTIESLAKNLAVNSQEEDSTNTLPSESYKSTDIAIIGLSCKFPGANNIDEFWNIIVSGVEAITQFEDEELLKSGIDKTLLVNSHYKKVKGFLQDAEYFDSAFFNYSAKEAEVMDPQIRILHQCAWEALEDAGYDSTTYTGKIGLFAGSSSNLLWIKQWVKDDKDFLNAFEAFTLNEKDFLTTRLSYKLNLKGPSFNIQTACSTSLVAIHQAAQSLFSGESDMAIAGGVSISYPRKEGYLWHEGMIFSQDGHCRPFSDAASGIIPGNGCGLVLVKRLSDALRDQDHIYAIIKGSAINNDGIEKVGYTAPSINGQRTVIEAALKKSGILPEEINYLEAHGTATKIGDPIEIEALKTAWKTDKKNFCALGSVKANLGHLDAAAGVASIIKTALLLHHKIIPPLINFKNPNSLIDLEDSPFYINTEPKMVEQAVPMRAGVSSFGIGGTNVHIILEQAPSETKSYDAKGTNLLIFSARSAEALLNTSAQIISYLHNKPEINLSDAAWTLQVGRKAFEYRKVLVVDGGLNQNNKDVIDFLNNPGHKISDFKKADSIELEQRFANLLSTKNQSNPHTFIKKVGELWCEGLDIDWGILHENENKKRISLPTYVFDKKYYLNDPILEDISPESATVTMENLSIRQQLTRFWSQLFGCDTVHGEDDFFALGGDSLKAVSLAAQIQKFMQIKISLEDIFAHSVFDQMADWLISHTVPQASYKITPIKKQPYYETSSAQKRQYILHEMLGSSTPYNLAAVYLVQGEFKKDRFVEVIKKLVERHEAFRTKFTMLNDELIQIVEDTVDPIIKFEYSTEAEIERKIAKFIQHFDLSKAPLFRVKLITLSDKKHVLLIDMHHIIADQSSIAILVRDFTDLYLGKILPPLKFQYKDFASWQNSLLHKPEIKNQIDYWINEFKGEIPKLNFPTDFPRPVIQTFNGERLLIKLDPELNNKIEIFSKDHGLTPYMIFIATLGLVLWKYSSQNDLVIGTAIAGRCHADLKSIVGMFVNTLAIRMQVNEQLRIEEYLQYIKQKMINAYDNQECQFEQLIELLNIEKDSSRNPLFDVAINYLDLENNELVLEDLSINPWPNTKVYSKFDLVWNIEKKEADYFTEIEFNTALFKLETITALSNRLLSILSLILNNPKQILKEFSLLSPSEKQRVVYELNQTSTKYPKDKTLVELFEEQVQIRGNQTALIFNNETWSYTKLNNEANKIAAILVKHQVQQGQHVAIMLDRSPLQMACILGILKLGCAYVPIDPDNPIERTHFILQDSAVQVLLTHSEFNISASIKIILLDDKRIQPRIALYQTDSIRPQDSAYVIYTSGSTGRPKGVIISHQNVIRLVKETNYIEIKPEDKLLRLLNYAFDGSKFDIFGALLNGACLVIAPKEAAIDMSILAEIIRQQGITLLCTTTAQFNMLVDWDVTALKNVRKILFAGELASVFHSRKALEFLGQNRLIHAYGPTEATVIATYYPINHIDENNVSIPIGYPVSNCKAYILDKQGQPVPENVPGELYIGGDAVGIGYLNREELTLQKFLQDPFNPEERMYRTGDIVHRLPTDEIMFLGRQDFQIKIRGFRVELSEIELQIKTIPEIKDVIVISKEDQQGDKYIAAYYTVIAEQITEDQIRSILSEKLPEYMIPSHIKMIKSLPLNANGKIDLKALPDFEQLQNYSDDPRNKTEEIILYEMRKLLNRDIGIKDDFFKWGGHSLKAVALVHELLKVGIKIGVSEVFQYRTVEKLANLNQLVAYGKNNQDSIAVNPISLNDSQIKGLVEHLASLCCSFSKIICTAPEVACFPLSSQQRWQLMQGSMLTGFTTEIEGDIQESSLRKQLTTIVNHNQLLHSVIQNNPTPEWKERDISELIPLIERSIPYLDLREFDHKTKKDILNQVSVLIFTSPYQAGSFLWRMCCLRINQDKHLIIWGFNHIAFDGMSAEVIRNQILNGIQEQQKYQDYVLQLKQGPENIAEREIIEKFSLNKWQTINCSLMQKLIQNQNNTQEEITIDVPLTGVSHKTPWKLAFDIVIKLLRDYFHTQEISLGIVHYGRSYQHQNYYNCVGEFLDVVPVLVQKMDEEAEVMSLLEKCRLYSINFITLLVDHALSKRFSKIARLLRPAFKTNGEPQQFVLFNFQGYFPKNEKYILENALKGVKTKHLSAVTIVANYDEDNLTIRISGLNGLNVNKIDEIIKSYQVRHYDSEPLVESYV